MTVLRPSGRSSNEYTVVARFATLDDLHRWVNSTQRAEWLRRLETLTEERSSFSSQTGLETWFTLPGHSVIVPPPRYKMALLVFLAVYPLILIVRLLLALVLGGVSFLDVSMVVDFDFFVTTLLTSLSLVTLMTWVVMPSLTSAARRWLYPTS